MCWWLAVTSILIIAIPAKSSAIEVADTPPVQHLIPDEVLA